MNENAFQSICTLLKESRVNFKVLTHPPCRTSAESAATRAEAGAPEAIGAKAILCKIYCQTGKDYAVFVMPATYRMDSQSARNSIPGLKKVRFATSEEMLQLCGVQPGCMPPFGSPVFPGVAHLYIDNSISTAGIVGFNAADFCRSIVLSAKDYVRAVQSHARLITCAIPAGGAVPTGGGNG